MPNGYELDAGVLDGIKNQLNNARSDIKGLAGSVPGSVDAGLLSPPLDELLAHLVKDAAQFSLALEDTVSTVEENKRSYQHQEDTTARGFQGQAGGHDGN